MNFCALSSGSDGNCVYVETENTKIIIDAGLSGKAITDLLKCIDVTPSDLDAIVVTHEHIDHIKGVGVLSRKFDLPVIANELTWKAMSSVIGEISERNIKIFKTWEGFSIKGLDMLPMGLSHDAADPVGFVVERLNKKITVLTDTGIISKRILNEIKGSDLYYIEANHDIAMLENGPYPLELKRRIRSKIGHMSNDYCAAVLEKALIKGDEKLVLGHLSETNNVPEIACESVEEILVSSGRKPEKDYKLTVAAYKKNTKMFYL